MSFLGISIRKETVPIARGGWLDAMRFIVATMIILHHFQLAAPIPLARIHPVFERGYLLTDFFLIDSGYVLGRIYGDRVLAGGMSLLTFFRKRAVRVCPAHLIMALVLIAFVAISGLLGFAPRHKEWFDPRELPAQFFLVQSFGVPGGRGWNAPSWSISALLGCYLCFPLLIRWIGKPSPFVALALGIGAFAVADVLTWSLLGYPVYQMPLKYGFIRALPLFFLGMTLARFSSRVFIPTSLARTLGIGALLALALLQVFAAFSLLSLGLICLMILAAAAIPVLRPSWLVQKAAVVSFSMYITNEVFRIAYFGVVNAAEARIAMPDAGRWALWTGGVLGALAFATLFHYVVDMPTQRWLQPRFARLLAGRRSAGPGLVAAGGQAA
ncbi:MAG TPA: acyltransferase [Caulobacteraceae bacterium]